MKKGTLVKINNFGYIKSGIVVKWDNKEDEEYGTVSNMCYIESNGEIFKVFKEDCEEVKATQEIKTKELKNKIDKLIKDYEEDGEILEIIIEVFESENNIDLYLNILFEGEEVKDYTIATIDKVNSNNAEYFKKEIKQLQKLFIIDNIVYTS